MRIPSRLASIFLFTNMDSMFLAKINFGKATIPPGVDPPEYGTDDLVQAVLYGLQKHGQICGDFVFSTHHQEVVAYAYLPRTDSLEKEHHSKYVLSDLKKLAPYFPDAFARDIMDDGATTTFPTLETAPSVYLFTTAFDGHSPVCCGETGERIPLYELPLTFDEREGCVFWAREYARMDGIWFSSGELEIPAYRQMADPASLLAKQGRGLLKKIEQASGVPAYYYLTRYYGREKESEKSRRCPGCGGEWFVKTRVSGEPFHAFEFRCEPCRLVSHTADAHDEEELVHAEIGEWQDPSA